MYKFEEEFPDVKSVWLTQNEPSLLIKVEFCSPYSLLLGKLVCGLRIFFCETSGNFVMTHW